MASPRLRLGISGCGGIARYIFNECIGLECIQPVAGYDPNRANLAKFQEITSCEAVESYEALIGRKDIDAVVLAAPPLDRVPQVLPAAQAGKAIFSEKPLALSVAEGKRLVDGCHAAKVPLMVGQVLRFFGGFGRMVKYIHEGAFGKPLALQSNRLGTPFPSEYRDDWRLKQTTTGGLLFEVHVHEFDLSRCLCGKPLRVSGQSRRYGIDPETDFQDLLLGTIEFDSGAMGQYHFSQVSAHNEVCFKVYLEKGAAWATFGEAWVQRWDKEPELIQPEEAEEAPYRKEIRLFAEAVLKGEPMPIPGEEGLWNVAMAEAFEKSAASGKIVEVNVS